MPQCELCVCVSLQHFDTGHNQQMTSVLHCHGLLATASKDGSVRLYTPSSPPSLCSILNRQSYNAITDLDLCCNALAVARGRNIAVWSL